MNIDRSAFPHLTSDSAAMRMTIFAAVFFAAAFFAAFLLATILVATQSS
jgi:hypothetical protein